MSKSSLSELLKAAEAAGLVGQGGEYLKMREGANRVRILSEPLPHPGSYKGTPNFKWFTRVIDREDGKIKVWFMPHTIFRLIRDLQESDDYGFEDCPMPYDVTVQAKNAGTKEVEYSVVPARKNTPLSADELDVIDALKPLKEVQAAIRGKTEEKESKGFDPDEIPV